MPSFNDSILNLFYIEKLWENCLPGGFAVASITTSLLLYNLCDMHTDDGDLNKRENKRRK